MSPVPRGRAARVLGLLGLVCIVWAAIGSTSHRSVTEYPVSACQHGAADWAHPGAAVADCPPLVFPSDPARLVNIPIQGGRGQARFELQGVAPGSTFEVRASYQGSAPVTVRVALVHEQDVAASPKGFRRRRNRELLDLEKAVFSIPRTDLSGAAEELPTAVIHVVQDGWSLEGPLNEIPVFVELDPSIAGVLPLSVVPAVVLLVGMLLLLAAVWCGAHDSTGLLGFKPPPETHTGTIRTHRL